LVSPEFIQVMGVVLWPFHSEDNDRVERMKMLGSTPGPVEEEILKLSSLEVGFFARWRDPKGFYGACKPAEWCVQAHVLSRDWLEAEMAVVG